MTEPTAAAPWGSKSTPLLPLTLGPPNPAGSGQWGILTPAPHTHRWALAQKQAFSPALLSKQRMWASSTHSPVSGGVITLLQPTQ